MGSIEISQYSSPYSLHSDLVEDDPILRRNALYMIMCVRVRARARVRVCMFIEILIGRNLYNDETLRRPMVYRRLLMRD